MDLKRFGLLMMGRAKALPINLNDVKKDVATKLLTSYAMTTPIDTGLAVSNYIISINVPTGEVIRAHVPGSKRSTAQANINATITAGTAVINTALPGQTICLTNLVDYISDLDRGTSTQAPAGMSATAFLNAKNVIRLAKVVS